MTWHVTLTNHSKMLTLIIKPFCDLLSINLSFFTSTTAMAPTSITAFRPFNLQHDEGENLYVRLQQVIYYGESRFRAAVARIIKADVRHHGWMQTCLQQELVCLLFVYYYLVHIHSPSQSSSSWPMPAWPRLQDSISKFLSFFVPW